MPFSNSQYIDLKDIYTSWFVDNISAFKMEDKYSPFLLNVRIDWKGIKKRPGHELLKDLAVSGETAKGIGSYERAVKANSRIVVRYNIDATHDLTTLQTNGTQVDITTASNITVDDRMEFLNIGDVLYCFNGTDKIGKLDWTTYSVITESVLWGNLSPSFWVYFDGKMWVSGWAANSAFVFYSVGNTPEDFTSSGSDQIQFQEQLTWLATTNQTLFYFSEQSVSMTDKGDIIDTAGTKSYITRSMSVDEWAVNHASIVSVWDKVFYVTPSNTIAQLARGTSIGWYERIELSSRQYRGIERTMATLDADQSDSFGYYIPNADIIKWHFKSNWSTFNDVCVIYDLKNDAFLRDTRKFFFAWTIFQWNPYAVSMLDGKVYQDETGKNDNWLAVAMEYRTKEFDLGQVSRIKQFWEYRNFIEINELASLSIETYVDWGLVDTATIDSSCVDFAGDAWLGTEPVGTFQVWAPGDITSDATEWFAFVRPKSYLQNKGNTIQFRYKESTLGALVTVQDLQLRAEIMPALENNRTC